MFSFVDFMVRELLLFAAAGFLIGGFDDLAIDLIWISRSLWRRIFIYHRYDRVDVTTLATARLPGRIAVFIPAWDEAAVIGSMLRNTAARFGDGDYRIYVGAYPNDPATVVTVNAVASPHVRLVIGDEPGPTTKAACLNQLWRAMVADEMRGIMYHLPEAPPAVNPLISLSRGHVRFRAHPVRSNPQTRGDRRGTRRPTGSARTAHGGDARARRDDPHIQARH